jgi:membrane protein YqaA with SNARE-associated domain/outer membrane lipoprotein-sorting protein
MSFLTNLSHWLVQTLEPYGAPGLMLIAIGDSSFLSLPEVNDAALMALSINNPVRMWELATMTVIGSVIGCCLLYAVGRRGGESLLHRRFAAEKVLKVRAWYQKYGMLAVIVPSLLPPPLPFKIFVLSAGAFEIPWTRFILAVAIGRSIRYFAEGLIAVYYGQQAMQIVADNFAFFGVVLATLIVIATLFFVYFRRRKLNARVMMMSLLLIVFGSGCVKSHTVPLSQRIAPSRAFSLERAIERLEKMSTDVQSMTGSVRLSGTTPSTKKANTILEPPFAINGALIMKRPKIYLKGTKGLSLFEMVSDGKQYQIYAPQSDELYLGGQEEGPAYKKFPHLGDTENQLVSIRPGKIQDALMFDVVPLLRNPSVTVSWRYETVVEPDSARRCFVVDFVDASQPKQGRELQTYWFDLGTDYVDLWRRKTYTRTGQEETDARYTGYEPVPSTSLRYPSRVDVHFFNTDTWVKLELDPKQMNFNERNHETGERQEISDQKFSFDTHTDAKKVYRFEALDAAADLTQQR